jgi:hypothetical protein
MSRRPGRSQLLYFFVRRSGFQLAKSTTYLPLYRVAGDLKSVELVAGAKRWDRDSNRIRTAIKVIQIELLSNRNNNGAILGLREGKLTLCHEIE